MAAYRSRPQQVEAWQWDGAADLVSEAIPGWVRGAAKVGNVYLYGRGREHPQLVVRTPFGAQPVVAGDWLIMHPRGALSRCAADTFHTLYEETA